MQILDIKYFGNSLLDWSIAIAITIALYVVSLIVRRVILKQIRRFAEKTETKFDDLFAELLSNLKHFPIILFAIYIGSMVLSLQPKPSRYIEIIFILSILLQGGFWGNQIINFFIGNYLQKRGEIENGNKSVPAILAFVSRIILWGLILLLILDNLGINITTLLAGLGIGGIAIALALQSILEDLFASLSIFLDKPFEVGDFIVVGEFLGTVEHIGLKSTRIRSLSGEQNIFSNTDLLKSRIRNFKRMSERRVLFTIKVTYQTAFKQLKNIPTIVQQIITNQANTRFDRAHFKEFGDSSLVFEIVYYILSSDYNIYMDIQEKINGEIFLRFEQEQIAFAYPTRMVIVSTENGNTDS